MDYTSHCPPYGHHGVFWMETGFRHLLGTLIVQSDDDGHRGSIFHANLQPLKYSRGFQICLIIFISLYLLSYWIISLFKSKSDNDSLYAGDEDYFVYRISVWMCSASLAVSIGSIALLPFSVVSSELLQRYPDNYYLQWMSWSLINSLWNYVFALSNLSLFVLLPFSYFFIESQGFSKNKNGIMQRVYETLAVCALLIVVVLCLGDVVLTLISSSVSLISITSVNLPLIYSFVSFAGVMLLLMSTPIGFAKMFGIVGEMTMVSARHQALNAVGSGISPSSNCSESCYLFSSSVFDYTSESNTSTTSSTELNGSGKSNGMRPISFGRGMAPLRSPLVSSQVTTTRLLISSLRVLEAAASDPQPGISLLMVVINSLKLVFGFRSLPVYAQYMEVHTRHSLGIAGVIIESITIMYVMATSLTGLYSMPFVRALRPQRARTSLTVIIINCSLVLVLSSALPVLANTLGITSFDLLGAYSSLKWLSNFKLVLAYNVLFAGLPSPAILSSTSFRLQQLRCRRAVEDDTITEKVE
ncbi:unnamed protein product [Heligmosomoides polygyrus]|uniref:G_PROTEIN_RECEP_F1_2 domain-containing protein n=1 Tax=Heligmosomoides polygyrus TaxID=6339 RepID=A0A3P7XF61_HELPZ|nr:unnamed protein product [Heligmosomoides polygyrus]